MTVRTFDRSTPPDRVLGSDVRRTARRRRQIARVTLRMLAASFAAVGAVISLPALASDPPECDDPRVLVQIRLAHEQLASTLHLETIVAIDTHESSGESDAPGPAASDNRDAAEASPRSTSRFCVASLSLAGGGADTAYYRIDRREDGPGEEFATTPCFDSLARYYSAQDNALITCAAYMHGGDRREHR